MPDWGLAELERKVSQDPGNIPLLINYLSVLRRTADVLNLELFLTSHVQKYTLPALRRDDETTDQALLDLGLVPGAYTKAASGHTSAEACAEAVAARLIRYSEHLVQLIGGNFIHKIDGDTVARNYFASDDAAKVEKNIVKYRTRFTMTPAQIELLRTTMRTFSYPTNKASSKGLDQYMIFIPAWALQKVFVIDITRTRQRWWFVADSRLASWGNDWIPTRVKDLRRLLVGAITQVEEPSNSFLSLKLNGMFELDRHLDLYRLPE